MKRGREGQSRRATRASPGIDRGTEFRIFRVCVDNRADMYTGGDRIAKRLGLALRERRGVRLRHRRELGRLVLERLDALVLLLLSLIHI